MADATRGRDSLGLGATKAHNDSRWRLFAERRAFIKAAEPVEERPSVIERAFQIAKSGAVASIAELTGQLTAEGYANAKQILAGRSLALQVTRMIAETRTPANL